MDSNVFRDVALGVNANDWEEIGLYKDIAIAACILHDCCKASDDEKHKTKFDHPLIAAKLFKDCARNHITSNNMDYMKKAVPLTYSCIASHMGKWSKASYAKGIVLPEPKVGVEVFVHLCDYIASRKFFDFNFNVYNEVKK